MNIQIFDSKLSLGEAAARDAAAIIQQAITARDVAYVIAATGASQFEFLDALVVQQVDWNKVIFFHLDEYGRFTREPPRKFSALSN